MKITKKELAKIVQEEFGLEKNKRLKKRGVIKESFLGTDNSGLTVDSYDLSNDGNDIIVQLNNYEPVRVDGERFIDSYEKDVEKKFPSIMTSNEILMSFKNTKKDISEYLKSYIKQYLKLKPTR